MAVPPAGERETRPPPAPLATPAVWADGDVGMAPDPTNVIVNYVPTVVGNDELSALFAPFGTLVEARVITKRGSSAHRGFAFVKYATAAEASAAVAAMNGREIHGKRLRVAIAVGQAPTPQQRAAQSAAAAAAAAAAAGWRLVPTGPPPPPWPMLFDGGGGAPLGPAPPTGYHGYHHPGYPGYGYGYGYGGAPLPPLVPFPPSTLLQPANPSPSLPTAMPSAAYFPQPPATFAFPPPA